MLNKAMDCNYFLIIFIFYNMKFDLLFYLDNEGISNLVYQLFLKIASKYCLSNSF